MPIEFKNLVFSLLAQDSDVSSFRCSEYYDLEDFIKSNAKRYQEDRIAITYLVHYENHLIGFFSLAMGCITAASVKDMKRNVHYDEKKYPALLLARIATHDDYRRMGIGSHMLKYVFASAFRLCPFVGCRFIKVNAIKSDGTLNFYKTYGGFREITESADTVEMVVDLNEVDVPDRPFPE